MNKETREVLEECLETINLYEAQIHDFLERLNYLKKAYSNGGDDYLTKEDIRAEMDDIVNGHLHNLNYEVKKRKYVVNCLQNGIKISEALDSWYERYNK